jgi:hypothetical protein
MTKAEVAQHILDAVLRLRSAASGKHVARRSAD